MDDKLCSRKQELCHVEQELNETIEKLEEIAERKQYVQFDGPGLQNAAAKKVTEVCTWSHFSVVLLTLIYVNADHRSSQPLAVQGMAK